MMFVVVLALSGCFVLGVDPVGTDAPLRLEWTINDQPANAFWCRNATFDLVRMNVNSGFRSPAFTWPCTNGAYDSGTENVLRAGDYSVFFEGVDASGQVVETTLEPSGGAQRMTVQTGMLVDLGVQRFVLPFPGAIELMLEFEATAGVGDYMDCAGAAVTAMAASLESATAEPVATASATCPPSRIGWTQIPYETYQVRVEARDAGGALLWTGSCPTAAGGYVVSSTSPTRMEICQIPHL